MAAPRQYLIGCPAWLTVADDGTVTASVDLSEASDAPHEGPDLYDGDEPLVIPDDIRTADAARIASAVASASVHLDAPGAGI